MSDRTPDPAGWNRISELEAQIALIRRKYRALWAGLVAIEPLLNKPYPDDPRWTPWSRFVQPRLHMMDAALRGEDIGELAGLRLTTAAPLPSCRICGEPAEHHLVSCPLVGSHA